MVRILLMIFGGFVLLGGVLVALALVFGTGAPDSPPPGGWELKSGQGKSLFAVAAPTKSTLNLKVAAVACEVVDGAHIFHLQLYPAGQGPLLPSGANANQLKDQAHVRLEIDGKVIQANIYFAEEFAVVANQVSGGRAVLTPAVGETLEKGQQLTVRFDLVKEQRGDGPFDAYAFFDLAAGRSAIGAVRRRCNQ